MRERRKLVAVSAGRLELEALNAPENGERKGCGALPHTPAGASCTCTGGTSGGRAQEAAEAAGTQDPAAGVVYRDWGVCRALGWRRRKLVALRKGLRRGVDWDVCEGEVGMLGAWCARQGLDVSGLARAGGEGLVSVEVVGFVANRQLVLARTMGKGLVGPVRVRDAGDFRRGDVFEVDGGARIVGPWPRRDW